MCAFLQGLCTATRTFYLSNHWLIWDNLLLEEALIVLLSI